MKRYNSMQTLAVLIATAVMLLAGCTQNDLTEPNRPLPPAGMGEITLGQLQLLGSETAAARSRAGASSNLPEGSTLRLYAFAVGETSFNKKLATRTYTINATGAAQLDPGQDPLFLAVGKADIYLAGPVAYNSGTQVDPVMVEVAAEWGIYPHIGVDLIATYAQATIVAGHTNPLPSMTLEHKMARAQIVVESNTAAVYENLVVQEVKLYGQPTTGTFTLDHTGGAITAGGQFEDFVYSAVVKDPTAEKYRATTVLIPQAEREFKVETTFECNQINTEVGDDHPTIKYRQSGLITAPLAAGTATRFTAAPITPVEIKWRTKVLPWNQMQGEDLVVEGPQTEIPYIEINGLLWAKGNLVANGANSAKIGKPGDNGLYFQYGGLIGYKGGATGDGTGITNAALNNKYWGGTTAYSANDVAVKPTTYTQQGTWPFFNNNVASGGFGYYYFSTSTSAYSDFQAQTNGHNPALGIGDPCAYYLGGGWRLPKYDELSAITGNTAQNTWISWSTANVTGKWSTTGPQSTIGSWFGPNSRSGSPTVDTDLFIPASGLYNYTNGAFALIGVNGYLWSSSIYDYNRAFHLDTRSSGLSPRAIAHRPYGFPVRCVKPK